MKKQWNERQFLKLISVIFAVALWFYVLHTSNVELEKKIQLQFTVPSGKAIANQVATVVTVKVRGPRMFIRGISSEVVDIDLENRKEDKLNVSIAPSDISLPFGVELLDYGPKNVEVILQRKISKYVPIKAQLVGKVSEKLRLMSKKMNPSRVLIEGPVNELRKIGSVATIPIDLGNLEGDGSLEVSLEALDSRVSIKKKQKFQFNYSVRSKKANLTLEGIKIRYLSSRRRFSSSYWTVSLSVLAPEGVKRQIDKSKVQVIAELPEGVKGDFTIKLRAILPEGVHLLEIHPEKIPVTIK